VAEKAGKPLVFEEFGFPRDGGLYSPSAPTTFRERYYELIYAAAEAHSSGAGGSVSGTNFWGWSGEARAQHGDHRFHPGDTQYMGDPPHEPQGWYGNFDSDERIGATIREHSARFGTV
jgi:mannan endo-1,4-beta-mannosidase